MARVTHIVVYPIRFCAGITLPSAIVQHNRLQFDQQYVLTDFDGKLITDNRLLNRLKLSANLTTNQLTVTAPDGQSITITSSDFSPQFRKNNVPIKSIFSYIASIKINRWFSDYLAEDIQLRWYGNHLAIPSLPNQLSLLLINSMTADVIGQKYKRFSNLEKVRANIIINNPDPFIEKSWTIIRIGEIIFKLIEPGPHYPFATNKRITNTLDKMEINQSLLKRSRPGHRCKDHYGIYMTAMNGGIIRVGDQIEIIATKSNSGMMKSERNEANKPINIQYKTINLQGNNQQTILEQLEQNKIDIPYSCRSGICGCCQIELIEGEVTPLTPEAIKDKNKILACSCRPKGDIKIR